MILALLLLLIIVAGSGWLSETDAYFGVAWVDRLHHYSAHVLLVLVGLHLTGVAVSSWLHRENLVLAMITGRKRSRMRSKFQDEGRTTTVAPHSSH
jgi:cytochrome b